MRNGWNDLNDSLYKKNYANQVNRIQPNKTKQNKKMQNSLYLVLGEEFVRLFAFYSRFLCGNKWKKKQPSW